MNNGKAELIERAKSGDSEALSILISENTGLVKSIAVRFTGRGVEYEDLCQIGHIGMIKAIRNFDLSRGTAFSTYAVPLIIGEIKRFLRDDGEIKISRELKRRGALIMAEREKYITRFGCEPTVSELAARCNLSEEEAISFEKKVSVIDKTIYCNETEIQQLREMSSLLLSKLTN